MVFINKGILCKHEGCKITPSYNYRTEKRALYCATHKLEDMINVSSKLCINEWCDTVVSSKFNGYCFYCFIKTFPDDQIVRNYKTKEKSVMNYIKTKYPEFTLVFDKPIQNGCSKRRPDIYLDLGYQVIIVEIDEHQHTEYETSCENKRIMEISQDVNHRPIVFIRFNPDQYISNKRNITSCWRYNKNGTMNIKDSKKEEWNTRLNTLSQTIDYWVENKTEKLINNIFLFYDQ
jgi:hypothetical protein